MIELSKKDPETYTLDAADGSGEGSEWTIWTRFISPIFHTGKRSYFSASIEIHHVISDVNLSSRQIFRIVNPRLQIVIL